MTIKQLKIANILVWGGALLLSVGLLMQYPTLQPYLSTLARTDDLATAPPLDPELSLVEGTTEANLLPFEGEEATYHRRAKLAEAPHTPPLPTATLVPAATQPTPASLEETAPITPTPTPVPTPTGVRPKALAIPDLDLEAPIVPMGWKVVGSGETAQARWLVPDWKAVGWHNTSGLLGVSGNTVLNGHNTTRGEVFRDLYQLERGARIVVTGENNRDYAYKVEHIYILEEAGQSLDVRLENARYILATKDDRLTLITCHPYASTRYRLIVIAFPDVLIDRVPE